MPSNRVAWSCVHVAARARIQAGRTPNARTGAHPAIPRGSQPICCRASGTNIYANSAAPYALLPSYGDFAHARLWAPISLPAVRNRAVQRLRCLLLALAGAARPSHTTVNNIPARLSELLSERRRSLGPVSLGRPRGACAVGTGQRSCRPAAQQYATSRAFWGCESQPRIHKHGLKAL